MESNTRASLPPGPSVSTIAGTLPFGLIGAEGGRCCSPLLVSTGIICVRETGFFQKERDLRRVGSGVEIEADHGVSFGFSRAGEAMARGQIRSQGFSASVLKWKAPWMSTTSQYR